MLMMYVSTIKLIENCALRLSYLKSGDSTANKANIWILCKSYNKGSYIKVKRAEDSSNKSGNNKDSSNEDGSDEDGNALFIAMNAL